MAKYIDADIIRNHFKADLSRRPKSFLDDMLMVCVDRVIKNAPAADVAEVNRCKTCFHYKPREYGYNCTVLDWDVNEDDFCSRWEAKDE